MLFARRVGAAAAVAGLLLGCDGEKQEKPAPPVRSSIAPDLYAFEEPAPPPPPAPAPPAAPPPAPIVVHVEPPASPPAPPPAPAPAPAPAAAPVVFEDPRPALRAQVVGELRALRQQQVGIGRARGADLASLGGSELAAPGWRLKDPDYRQRDPRLPEDKSTLPVDRFRVITADRYIGAILENAVNSQIPGRIIAVVERHVFGADGRLPLLPKGTRIICSYESLAKVGDSRLNVKCSRALRPDGASVQLTDAAGADQMGKQGFIGDVDLRVWERYGSAFIVSALAALSSAGSNVSQNNQTVNNASNALSQNLGQVTAKVLEQSVDLAPIVTVPAGSRVQIIPNTDIWIRDPEAMKAVAKE